MPSPSAERSELHTIDDAAACALVDAVLGRPETWRSHIIQYRFTSDFQSHWKAEIGHWIHTARKHGFEDRLVERARVRANDPGRRVPTTVTEADRLYRVLLEELHPAMVAHYLLTSGWSFWAWDTPDGVGGDVDLAVTAPGAIEVDIQIKVPGQHDPMAALDKAARQLATTARHAVIFVCSRDPIFVSCSPGTFLTGLMGSTLGEYGSVRLTKRGAFGSPPWVHVSAVCLLDYIPGAARQQYACTALLNPWCDAGRRADRAWLARARVLELHDDRFHWHPIEPDEAGVLPNGTFVPIDLR